MNGPHCIAALPLLMGYVSSVPGFLRLFGKTLLTICEMPSGKLSPGRNEGIIHRLWGNLGHRPKKSGLVLASGLVFTGHLAD